MLDNEPNDVSTGLGKTERLSFPIKTCEAGLSGLVSCAMDMAQMMGYDVAECSGRVFVKEVRRWMQL
jgi:hypothetical protein